MGEQITAEQVERAIEMARVGSVYLSDLLGPGINWSLHAPDYVCREWISPPRPPKEEHIAALTRWHAELVAAERPDDTAPERLRERREALGWTREDAAREWGGASYRHGVGWCESNMGPHCLSCQGDRVGYAAALSAEEARRADILADNAAQAAEDREAHAQQRMADLAAPEVVDVPQPIVKRCGNTEARWELDDEPVCFIDSVDHGVVYASISLLRAMLEAIDAQQGGAS